MTYDIPFAKLAIILTFFVLAATISYGLMLHGQIPSHTIVLNLFGNNNLLGVFGQVTTVP